MKLALVGEIGRDQVEAPGGTRKLTKFTIAPTWSPSGPGFWERPEIRLYYTYASWNRAAQQAANLLADGSALSENGAFGSARNGSACRWSIGGSSLKVGCVAVRTKTVARMQSGAIPAPAPGFHPGYNSA